MLCPPTLSPHIRNRRRFSGRRNSARFLHRVRIFSNYATVLQQQEEIRKPCESQI